MEDIRKIIDDNIYDNDEQAITGKKLNEVLQSIVDVIDSNSSSVDPAQLEAVIGLSIPHDVNDDFNEDFAI